MAAASGDPAAVIDLEDFSFGTPGPHHFEDSISPTDPFSSQDEQDLSFLHSSHDHGSSDGSDPGHIQYSVDWKVALRKGQRLSWLTHQTEDSTISLPPETYWERTLKAKLAAVLESKVPGVQCVPEETNIILAVKYRSSVRKNFPGQQIQWSVVEDQLRAWSHLLHEGKQLGIKISFIHKCSGDAGSTVERQRSRRGATNLERAELDTINAQRTADGVAVPWIDVYYLMRCPGPPCKLGPYCWIDADDGNKHYKLTNSLLSRLIDYTEAGNQFVSHKDVPQTIQDELKAGRSKNLGAQRGRPLRESFQSPLTYSVAPSSTGRVRPWTSLDGAQRHASPELAWVGHRDSQFQDYRTRL